MTLKSPSTNEILLLALLLVHRGEVAAARRPRRASGRARTWLKSANHLVPLKLLIMIINVWDGWNLQIQTKLRFVYFERLR